MTKRKQESFFLALPDELIIQIISQLYLSTSSKASIDSILDNLRNLALTNKRLFNLVAENGPLPLLVKIKKILKKEGGPRLKDIKSIEEKINQKGSCLLGCVCRKCCCSLLKSPSALTYGKFVESAALSLFGVGELAGTLYLLINMLEDYENVAVMGYILIAFLLLWGISFVVIGGLGFKAYHEARTLLNERHEILQENSSLYSFLMWMNEKQETFEDLTSQQQLLFILASEFIKFAKTPTSYYDDLKARNTTLTPVLQEIADRHLKLSTLFAPITVVIDSEQSIRNSAVETTPLLTYKYS